MRERDNRPGVTIHYAQTLDGRIATCTGQSQWIGGERSLALAHQLRAEHEVVMVGIGTVLADNPRLTVRLAPGSSPRRLVVDSTLRIPLDAHVLTDGAAETLLATTARAPEDRLRAVRRQGAEVLVVQQETNGQVDLRELLGHLAARGIGSVLIEGGSGLITSALRARVVDRLVVCIAPRIIGTGIAAIGDLSISHLSEAIALSRVSLRMLGNDLIFEALLMQERSSGA